MDLTQGTVAVLQDAKYFLERISPDQYSQTIELMSGASIGQHTRHFIEFYQCLLNQAATKEINYCLRKRDISIEQNPDIAPGAIDTILQNIQHLSVDTPILLSSSKGGTYSIHSTLGRELYYNIEHCIHHLALIKIAIKVIAPTMELPEHFGVAPSTLQHRKLVTQ